MHTATRSLLALTISNGIGQIVGLAGGVLLAALFTPADFGRFSLFANVLGICILVGTLRCDQYLMIGELAGEGAPRRELALGASATLVTTAVLCVAVGLAALAAGWWTAWQGAVAVLAAVPAACLAGCLGNLAVAAFMRVDRVGRVALVANARIVATLALQLALLPLIGGWALIAGATLGLMVALALALPGSGLVDAVRGRAADAPPRRRLRDLAGHLRLSGQVLLTESSAMIVGSIILASHGAAVAGVYYLAFRFLQVPLNLTYTPLRQALVVALREDRREQVEGAWVWLRRLPRGVRAAFATVLVGYALVFLLGGWAGRLLAGTAWVDAGEYGRWIAMYLFSSIATIPAHAVLMRMDRTGIILGFSVASLVARVIAVLLGAQVSAEATVAGFGLASAATGAVFLVVALRVYHRHHRAAEGAA